MIDYPELTGVGRKRRRCEVPEGSTPVCLIRATDGHRKISTTVRVDLVLTSDFIPNLDTLTSRFMYADYQVPDVDVARFASGMSAVMRLGISNLEKPPKK